jgi:hypothetical protein
MTQLKQVQIHGMLKDISDNFSAIAPIGALVGIGNLRCAVFQFDGEGKDSAGVSNLTAAAHGTGVKIPAQSVVIGGFVEVNTAFTSTNSTSQIAIKVEGANDIISATAVSGAPYSTIGRKAITPKTNTPESTSIKVTTLKEITCTVSVEALLTGKLTGYLFFVEGVASA